MTDKDYMKTILVLSIALLITGCTLTYDSTREERTREERFVKVQEALAMLNALPVKLTLRNGTVYEGVVAQVATDTLELRPTDQSTHINVGVDQVLSAFVTGGTREFSFAPVGTNAVFIYDYRSSAWEIEFGNSSTNH